VSCRISLSACARMSHSIRAIPCSPRRYARPQLGRGTRPGRSRRPTAPPAPKPVWAAAVTVSCCCVCSSTKYPEPGSRKRPFPPGRRAADPWHHQSVCLAFRLVKVRPGRKTRTRLTGAARVGVRRSGSVSRAARTLTSWRNRGPRIGGGQLQQRMLTSDTVESFLEVSPPTPLRSAVAGTPHGDHGPRVLLHPRGAPDHRARRRRRGAPVRRDPGAPSSPAAIEWLPHVPGRAVRIGDTQSR
jgi:hypothetical protein